MKTFSEFILEAEVAWHSGTLSGSKKSPSATASQKMTQLGRKMSDPRTTPQQMASIAQRVKKIKNQLSIQGEIAQTRDPRSQSKDVGRTNTKIRGYASKPRDVVSRVGTTSNVQRTDIPAEPDVITKDRYSSSGTSGGRGTHQGRTRRYGTRG